MSDEIDIIDRLAGLTETHPLYALRRERPNVVEYTQASDKAALRPHDDQGFIRADRAAVALAIAEALDDTALIDHYRALSNETNLTGVAGSARLGAARDHAVRLTRTPGDTTPQHLAGLARAGLSPGAIVALSQLVAYVNYKARVFAGLRMLKQERPLHIGGEARPSATVPHTAMRDFTQGELDWQPWLPLVDLDHATDAQRDALKVTPSNRAIGAYALTLAHDPETLAARSPLYNAIMFGPKGLSRADRELGAVVSSIINGCAYCASVHAKRFTELTKEPETMSRLYAEGLETEMDPRRRAIVDYSAKLTRTPAAVGAGDEVPLREQGLADAEILDLTHAVAMFAWANRLMQSLGKAS